MAAFVMFGKYSAEALRGMSAERTEKAKGIVAGLGGEVTAMYALVGAYDLVLIVNLPGVREAMKASVELTKISGISFSTMPAVSVDEFDKLFG
jgi:uncharacterized protein with GYD domain